MNTLEQLKDIHLPQPISMWPQTFAWYVLALLLFAMILNAFYFVYKRWRRKLAINFAITKLTKLKKLMHENPDKINIAAEISILLRRTALHYYPRKEIAALTGDAWIAFLNSNSKTSLVTQNAAALLTDVPYQREINANLEPLFAIAHNWLITISKQKELDASASWHDKVTATER